MKGSDKGENIINKFWKYKKNLWKKSILNVSERQNRDVLLDQKNY